MAGEEGADLEGLKPGGAFHMSCSILKLRMEEEEEVSENGEKGFGRRGFHRVRDVGEMEGGII